MNCKIEFLSSFTSIRNKARKSCDYSTRKREEESFTCIDFVVVHVGVGREGIVSGTSLFRVSAIFLLRIFASFAHAGCRFERLHGGFEWRRCDCRNSNLLNLLGWRLDLFLLPTVKTLAAGKAGRGFSRHPKTLVPYSSCPWGTWAELARAQLASGRVCTRSWPQCLGRFKYFGPWLKLSAKKPEARLEQVVLGGVQLRQVGFDWRPIQTQHKI